ncbi:ABC transporter permease [Rhodococcus sp. ABRD24]|uniref:ABC transporter permease n=1 Tax=Rhodococcus sp. ABRD24 TaxID=2507582 RepID=UPI001039299C|nr:ABC transporter permease [Rhodococcus sp. ABRD24]QBJ96436.1 ABC transporter permease [Rhodococcus sp. ABRD24]
MIWVIWRQHRTTILAAVGAILALTIVALICGVAIRGSARPIAFGTMFGCPKTGDGAGPCWSESSLTLITLGTTLLPALLGVLVGVTAFSRDIERGTHVVGLSQSVSRTRWYWTRLLVVFVPVTAAMALLGSVLEWTRSAGLESNYAYASTGVWYGYSRLTFPLFQSSGLVAAAYTFLALILGSLAALLLRNTLGAMVVTLAAMCAVTVSFQLGARPHYTAPAVEAQTIDGPGRTVAYRPDDENRNVWLLSSGFVDADGKGVEFDYSECGQIGGDEDWGQRPDETLTEYEAREDAINAAMNHEFTACQERQGIDRFEFRYHPDSLLRRFQLTEAAIALALSALLLIPSMWALRRLRP